MSGDDNRSFPDAELAHGFECTLDKSESKILLDLSEHGTLFTKSDHENKLFTDKDAAQDLVSGAEPTVQTLINLFENMNTFGGDTVKFMKVVQARSESLQSLEQKEENEVQSIASTSVNVSSEVPETQINLDTNHTLKETHNLLNVRNEAELNEILKKAESKLVFLFFMPGCCDLDNFHFQLLKTFLPQIQKAASQEPNILFITIYIDMLTQDWVQWTRIVDYFATCSKRDQTPIGSHLVCFQNSVRIHQSMIFNCEELDSAIAELIAKHQADQNSGGNVTAEEIQGFEIIKL